MKSTVIKSIVIIWIIFAVLFLYLSFSHWKLANEKINPFEIDLSGTGSNFLGVKSSNEAIKLFVKDFNIYIEKYNKTSHRQNRNSAIGYFFAGLTSFLSMLLVIFQNSIDKIFGEKLKEVAKRAGKWGVIP